MKIIDSHCHPQMGEYPDGREGMILRNLDAEVFMIAVGADLKSSKEAVLLGSKYEGRVWATVGCHPDEVGDQFQIADFQGLITDNVIAIGEVGLDYYRTPEQDKRVKQKDVFLQFANMAQESNLPLILHVRNDKNGASAHKDMVGLLSRDMRGVAHSFTGTLNEARDYLSLGFYLGFNGIITFANQYDEIVKSTAIDQILIETDAPWLSPVPYRGQVNEPMRVIEVAKRIAELKNLSLNEVINRSNKNCERLFGLKI